MDANGEQKDSVPVQGGDSDDKGQGDSNRQKTYTEDEVEKKFSQQRSVLDTKIGILEKTVTGKDTKISDLQTRLTQMEQSEEKMYQDDVPKLTEIRQGRTDRATGDELTKVRAELEVEKERGKERDDAEATVTRKEITEEIATRLEVDPGLLTKLAKTTDGSKDAIEAEAKDLPKVDPKTPLKLNSSRTAGGSGLEGLSASEKIAYALEHPNAKM